MTPKTATTLGAILSVFFLLGALANFHAGNLFWGVYDLAIVFIGIPFLVKALKQ